MNLGLLDRLAASRTNYWVGFLLDVVVSVALIAAGAIALRAWLSTLAALAVGWLIYTFYEYALHRWIYHGPPSPVRRIHAWHHRDDRMLGAPFFYSLGIAALHGAIAAPVVGRAAAAVFAGTLLAMYAAQSAIHHVAHGWAGERVPIRGSGLLGGLLGRLRRHHMIHHHGAAGANFGLSTTLWDRVFGTAVTRVERH